MGKLKTREIMGNMAGRPESTVQGHHCCEHWALLYTDRASAPLLHWAHTASTAPLPENPGKGGLTSAVATAGFQISFWPALGVTGKETVRQFQILFEVSWLPSILIQRKRVKVLRNSPPPHKDKYHLCCTSQNDQAIKLLNFEFVLIKPFCNISESWVFLFLRLS